MPVEFVKMSSNDLLNLPKDKSVFYFSVGPLEDHGPHLPLGLDEEEALRMSFLAAQHMEHEMPGWVGVVMPPAPLGIDSNTTGISITVRPHVLRDWLVDACRALIQSGFYHFVCFTGHLGPRQLTAIEEAGAIVRRATFLKSLIGCRPTLVSASSALVNTKRVIESPFWPDPKEHGGKRDTSMALAISEGSVDTSYKTLPKIERTDSRWKRNWMRRRGRLMGYWGDPAMATAKDAEEELLKNVEKLLPKLQKVWDGENQNKYFRSWYSILPPNRSFFKSWILALAIFFVASSWMYLVLNALPFD